MQFTIGIIIQFTIGIDDVWKNILTRDLTNCCKHSNIIGWLQIKVDHGYFLLQTPCDQKCFAYYCNISNNVSIKMEKPVSRATYGTHMISVR